MAVKPIPDLDPAGALSLADLFPVSQGTDQAFKATLTALRTLLAASTPLTGTPTAPTASLGTNTTQIASTAFVAAAVTALIAAAPGALDTLNELAAALGNDANYAATITTALAGKQPLDSDLTALAALSTTSYGRSLLEAANAGALRVLAGAVIGTDVEAHDADLTTFAGLTPSNDDILQRKSGAWANRTVAQILADLNVFNTLATSAVALTSPANTSENALATVNIPAGAMGPNGILRIHSRWTTTNSANNKKPRVRLGSGLAGTAHMDPILTTTATFLSILEIQNQNSASAQIGGFSGSSIATGASGAAFSTSAINTASAQDIVFSAEKASSGEVCTLTSYRVEVLYRP